MVAIIKEKLWSQVRPALFVVLCHFCNFISYLQQFDSEIIGHKVELSPDIVKLSMSSIYQRFPGAQIDNLLGFSISCF